MYSRVCFISYHELGLKGKNRSVFVQRLVENVRFVVDDDRTKVRKISGRLICEAPEGVDIPALAQRIAQVPGVASVSVADVVGRSFDEITARVVAVARTAIQATNAQTFRITAKRSNTDFALTSRELNERLGSAVVLQTGLKVNLTQPDLEIRVTVVGGKTYISAEKIAGAGGLPVGSSGRLISLLSTGIDSPVATWRMMRRGAVCIGLHFSGAPVLTDASIRLVHEIGEVLEHTGGLATIYAVAFGDIQREIASTVYPGLCVLVYRRVMLKVAAALAMRERAAALVTGESLGQVASQTLENIVATSHGIELPIFRPLIGDDKHDIVSDAQRIGTFDLSSRAAEDCCTLFMPRQPETRVTLERMEEACAMLDIDLLVEQAFDAMTERTYRCNR
ncbi:MAG: tRNA 4-thiouridine(8) synthase ThiI [Coriobacteriia bacterium]|nr:tRNA 4-thiouridine(8) synthase ThiI [Coriobacteriia bacterium]